jgi:hypothetical protein
VVERESRQIAERKQELLEQSLRIARRAANEIEAKIGPNARLSELVPVYGVAVDKIAALSSDTLNQNQQHLHLHLRSNDIARQFNALLHDSMKQIKAAKVVDAPNVFGNGSLSDDSPPAALIDETTGQRESPGA